MPSYGHVSLSPGLTKTISKGAVRGGRRGGRQKKSWNDNIRKWTNLEFVKSQRSVKNREKKKKVEEIGCEIICGAQTTFAVKR